MTRLAEARVPAGDLGLDVEPADVTTPLNAFYVQTPGFAAAHRALLAAGADMRARDAAAAAAAGDAPAPSRALRVAQQARDAEPQRGVIKHINVGFYDRPPLTFA